MLRKMDLNKIIIVRYELILINEILFGGVAQLVRAHDSYS